MKKDYTPHILITFVVSVILFLIANYIFVSSQKQSSDVVTGDYIVEDKIIDRTYLGKGIVIDYYFDVCDAADMDHKKRIFVPEDIYDKTEIRDIIKLKLYYRDDEIIDIEVMKNSPTYSRDAAYE